MSEQAGITCPKCNGDMGSNCHHNTGEDRSGHYWAWVNCDLCKGAGTVSCETLEDFLWGQRMRKIRIGMGVSIMDLSRKTGFSPAEISNFEWGRRR